VAAARVKRLARLALQALAITSALGFLAIMMVNACAHDGAARTPYMAPTKAAPVVNPNSPNPDGMRPGTAPAQAAAPGQEAEQAPPPEPLLAPATKSMSVVRPRPLVQPAASQRQGAAPQQAAPQQAAPEGAR
jgi:hypothetical protein